MADADDDREIATPLSPAEKKFRQHILISRLSADVTAVLGGIKKKYAERIFTPCRGLARRVFLRNKEDTPPATLLTLILEEINKPSIVEDRRREDLTNQITTSLATKISLTQTESRLLADYVASATWRETAGLFVTSRFKEEAGSEIILKVPPLPEEMQKELIELQNNYSSQLLPVTAKIVRNAYAGRGTQSLGDIWHNARKTLFAEIEEANLLFGRIILDINVIAKSHGQKLRQGERDFLAGIIGHDVVDTSIRKVFEEFLTSQGVPAVAITRAMSGESAQPRLTER